MTVRVSSPVPLSEMTAEFLVSNLWKRSAHSAWPTREVYIKGPGMIFKGNPAKYLTEIQVMIKTSPQES